MKFHHFHSELPPGLRSGGIKKVSINWGFHRFVTGKVLSHSWQGKQSHILICMLSERGY